MIHNRFPISTQSPRLFEIAERLGTSEMAAVLNELFPICRSITGSGVRETLEILRRFIPLELFEIESGSRVLDWEVPDEWNFRHAEICDSGGKVIVSTTHSNLAILNYSEPIRTELSGRELLKRLYRDDRFPQGRPYRTSYYQRTWGFCVTQAEYDLIASRSEELFSVNIEATLTPGVLNWGEFAVRGANSREYLISSHICHPSLANDNLSGVLVNLWLARILSAYAAENPGSLRNSYRFIFAPGTIGAIVWLHKNREKIENIAGGIILSLLGDSAPVQVKSSKCSESKIESENFPEIDLASQNAFVECGLEVRLKPYSDYGYDERQYNASGIGINAIRVMRSDYDSFSRYHSSEDSLEKLDFDALESSLTFVLNLVRGLELDCFPFSLMPTGEAQLSRHGYMKLRPNHINDAVWFRGALNTLARSDGRTSLLSISRQLSLPISLLFEIVCALQASELLKVSRDEFSRD